MCGATDAVSVAERSESIAAASFAVADFEKAVALLCGGDRVGLEYVHLESGAALNNVVLAAQAGPFVSVTKADRVLQIAKTIDANSQTGANAKLNRLTGPAGRNACDGATQDMTIRCCGDVAQFVTAR